MAKHTVTLIPGDGIGLETTAAMQRVVEAAGVDIEWEVAEAGAHMMDSCGTPLPEETIEAVRRNKVAIKGPITTPVGSGFRSVNVALRKTLNLNVCLRPVLSIPGAGGRYQDVDLVIVRENSEDLYAGIEFEEGSKEASELIEFCKEHNAGNIRPDSGISIKPISITASQNIVRYAFDYAVKHGRKKVTAAHKANNLYGDIASDLCAGLVGGLGIAPGANIGPEYAVFEAVHGSAPDIAGKDICNPTAEILSAAMMLDHLGELEAARKIRDAVRAVYAEGKVITADIRKATGSNAPAASCTQFTDELVSVLKKMA